MRTFSYAFSTMCSQIEKQGPVSQKLFEKPNGPVGSAAHIHSPYEMDVPAEVQIQGQKDLPNVVVGDATMPAIETANAPKRTIASKKRFREQDDLFLVKEIASNPPFLAARGKWMKLWDDIATKLRSMSSFGVTPITGRTCRSRFKLLIEKNTQNNRESARASGINEEKTELAVLLDDLQALKSDKEEEEAIRRKENEEKSGQLEESGEYVRDQAMQRMKRALNESPTDHDFDSMPGTTSVCNSASSTPSKRRRRSEALNAVKAMVEQQRVENSQLSRYIQNDMDMRRRQFEENKKERRFYFEAKLKEREEARKFEEQQRQEDRKAERENMMLMMQAFINRLDRPTGTPQALEGRAGKNH